MDQLATGPDRSAESVYTKTKERCENVRKLVVRENRKKQRFDQKKRKPLVSAAHGVQIGSA